MRRRRLVLVIAAAVLIVGLAWWLWPDSLSPEEQRLVGTWRPGKNTFTVTLMPDRRCLSTIQGGRPGGLGRWWVQGGEVCMDFEDRSINRALRSLLAPVGLPVVSVSRFPVYAFDIDGTNGPTTHWTRVRAD